MQRSRGVIKRGTVYVTLARMEQKGYLESWTELPPPGAIGLPRRLYRPTPYGAAVFGAWDRAARDINGECGGDIGEPRPVTFRAKRSPR